MTNSRFPAFQHPDFRLMWTSDLLAITGAQLVLFAVNWHVVNLLSGQTLTLFGTTLDETALKALALGTLGLARVLPILLFSLLGGLVADSRDRRQIVLRARVAVGGVSLLLALFTLTGAMTVPLVYLLSAATAGVNAFGNPARQALIPNLVPREHLTSALSLNTLMWQVATILGPALFAGLIPLLDIGWMYALNAGAFALAVLLMLRLRYRPAPDAPHAHVGRESLMEGLRFTFGSRIILSTMLLDFFATFFSSAQTMLPLVVSDVLRLDAAWYGILGTAQPIGAVLAGSVMAWRGEVRRQGRVLLAAVLVYGAATAVFGASTSFMLCYVMYALTGAGDTVSTVIRNIIRQSHTPDPLRGRMTGVNMMFFIGGPQLGELEAGIVAAAFGVPFSIVSGGVATVLLTLWIAAAYPQLREYTLGSDDPVPAAEG